MTIADEAPVSEGSETVVGDRMVMTGFIAGIVLAFVCFTAAAVYLFSFLGQSMHSIEDLLGTDASSSSISVAINVQTIMNKMALLSCGVFCGMAFGFLGFALFLIGVRGNVEVDAATAGGRIRVARLAPGLFVVICASVIISLSVTQRFQLSYVGGPTSSSAVTSSDAGPDSSTDEYELGSILESGLGLDPENGDAK